MQQRRISAWALGLFLALGWVLSVVVSAAETPAQPPAPHNESGVFAVSPIYTVLPDGSVAERADGGFGELSKHNRHFDAATNTVAFFGAQNQEVAVQIVIPVAGEKFAARAEAIDGIPADHVTFTLIAYDKVVLADADKKKPPVEKWLPDLLIPLDGSVAGIKRFDIPVKLPGLAEPANKQGLLLMELWIPKQTPPGLHHGQVVIVQGDKEFARLAVDLTVYAVELPDQPTFRMDYLSYGSPLKSLGGDAELPSGGATDFKTDPAAIAVEQDVFRMAADNRGYLNILPYASQRGNPLYGYPVAGVGEAAKIVSFDGFDARFGKVLDGKIGKYQVPPPIFELPFNLNYPCNMQADTSKQFNWTTFKASIPEGPGKEPKLKELEDTWHAVAQQTFAHFAEKGWTHTTFEIFNNQKPAKNNRSPWKLDEPVDGNDYKGLRYLFNLAHWSFEGADKKQIQVRTRLDIGHWECDRFKTLDGKVTACYKAKEFNSKHAEDLLKPVVDRWVAGYTHVHAAQDLIPEYNTDAVMFDEYGGAGQNISHGGVFVGLGWINARLGIEGYVIYKCGFNDPDLVDDDTILYSGKKLGYAGALASRRMKLWRDAVNDYELLRLAKGKNAAATAALLKEVTRTGPSANEKYRDESKTIETYFTNNVEDVQVAESIAAALAAGEKPADTLKLEGFSKAYKGCGVADTIVGYD